MINRLLELIMIMVIISFVSCNEEEIPVDISQDIEIISLIAEDSIIHVWIPTIITIEAKGDNLQYLWEADHGEMMGSGTSIEYVAGTCCTGINTITCTVYNDSGQKSKSIKIEVLPF